MKRLLFIVLLSFCFNVYAYEEAKICSYNVNNKTVSMTYYNSGDEAIITSFTVDGTTYDFYRTILTSDFVRDTYSSGTCPVVNSVNFYGMDEEVYFIANDNQQFNLLIASGDIVYKDDGDVFGQIVEGSINRGNKLHTSIVNLYYEEILSSSEVVYDTVKIMDGNIKAYALGGYCKTKEKNVIVNYFLENSFDSISSFNIEFDYGGEKVTLSDKCADVAYTLWSSTKNLWEILKFYRNNEGDVNKLSYLSLESSYYTAYSLLTSFSYDLSDTDKDACELISDDMKNILNVFFDSFRMICIVLVVFMIYLDGMKCLSAKDDSATKKWLAGAVKRLIILAIVLLLPFIIDIVLDLLNSYFSSNYVKIDGECVKAITGV